MKQKNMMKFMTGLLLALTCTLASAQKIQVKGTVTDEKGEPMPGVGVVDKGNARNGTVTDLDGTYSISVPIDGFLEFSFMSYNTALVSVDGKKTVDVQLLPSTEELEKVVVIGYGTSRKGDLTGAVAVVDTDDLQNAPVTSVAQALQGRVAGADFLSGNGEPSDAASIHIRGSRSISAGNQPLIVVDGILDAVSDLNEINPADIVSISVLKDVSSTAIYGARGANGVILITTNTESKDVKSKIKVNFKATAGVSQIAGKIDVLDAEGYATWRNMIARQNGAKQPPYQDPASFGKGTDWVDELSRTGVYQDYHLSLTGGNKDARYSASFGFHDNTGVVIGSGFKRYSGLTWINGRLAKNLKWGLRISYTHQDIDRSNAAISGNNKQAAIYLSPLLNTDAVWNTFSDEANGGVVFNNPYMSAMAMTNHQTKDITNIAPWLEYRITKSLIAKTKFSYMYRNDFYGTYSPSYLPYASANKVGGTASRADWRQKKYLSETTVNYEYRKRGHNLGALVGFTAERTVTDNATISGSGYVNDDLKYYNMSALVDNSNLSTYTYNREKTNMSVLARADYSYRRRYFATITARADGASNFAAGNKWGFFPAAALRWSVMNERFMSGLYWLNDLSIRASAGRSGNDAVSSYQSLATLKSAVSSWMFGNTKELAYYPSKLDNSDLTWETTDSYNVGLNFSVLNSRITLEADAYYSKTKDLLLNMKNTQTTGFSSYFTNVGSTENIGAEFSLSTQNVKRGNFNWSTTLIVAHNSQTVIDVGNDGEIVPTYLNPRNSTQYMYGYKNGYPVNALWGYKYAGVWHNQEEIDANEITHTYVSTIKEGSKGTNKGRAKYVDVNHDGVLDLDDMVYLGNSDPVIYGGFQNDFNIYKNLNLSVYFSYSLGGRIYNISELYLGSPDSSNNKYSYILDAWDEELRPDSDIQKAGMKDLLASDRHIHDASYLRLKNVSISYVINFKESVRKYIKSMTVGVSAENLYLWKYYNGFDPDVSTSSTVYRLDDGSLPRQRTFVFNLIMNF